MDSVKLYKYRPYKITFFDHSIGLGEEILIHAVGYYIKATNNAYVFSHWLVKHKDNTIVQDNLEPFAIVKKAIVKIEKLRTSGLLH